MECTPKAGVGHWRPLSLTEDGTASGSAPATDASPMKVEEDPVEDITTTMKTPVAYQVLFPLMTPWMQASLKRLKKVQKSKLVLRAKAQQLSGHTMSSWSL